VARDWQAGVPLPEALNRAADALQAAIRFGAQPGPMSAARYEQAIAVAGVVPTRECWHDFFNGLVWLCFPHIKRALNRLQVDALAIGDPIAAPAGQRSPRGPLRDALTIFDENAVFLDAASSALLQSLRDHDWPAVFARPAEHWHDIRVTVFGHALLDQLRQPRLNLTGHLWLGSRPPLASELLTRTHRTPLVLMGIPGWAIHAGLTVDLTDASIFRPRRHRPAGLERPGG
jgi:hypothetical protein